MQPLRGMEEDIVTFIEEDQDAAGEPGGAECPAGALVQSSPLP